MSKDDTRVTEKLVHILAVQGVKAEPYYLGNTKMQLGTRIVFKNCEIVFRIEGDTLIIIIYRRIEGPKKGLFNNFRPLIWLGENLIAHLPEIQYLRGSLDMLQGIGRTLSAKRLNYFYQNIMGAQLDEENQWVFYRLSNYKKN